MSDVVLFGLGRVAEVVYYYMTHESPFRVAGFTGDKEYLDRDSFYGLKVVPFEEVEHTFPPGRFALFVALGYQELNALRAARVAQAKEKGYSIPSFVHRNSGLPCDTTLGENGLILNHVSIQPKVRLGQNVFVWSGALIGHHSTIGDNCWITSNANIAGAVTIGRNCFLGINATIANDVTIGDNCFLGANCLVTKDLKDGQVAVQKSSEILRVNSENFLKFARFR